jgi:hypothetical protein
MGLFDSIGRSVTNQVGNQVGQAVSNAANSAVNSAIQNAGNEHKTFTFQAIPANVAELQSIPEANLSSPFGTAALTVLAMLRYEQNPSDCEAMLDYLRGPEPLSVFKKQFLKEHLGGKPYVARSYFAGTSKENNYTPSVPYTITVSSNPYSYPAGEGVYARLLLKSSGADSERWIVLRQKPSTGQWFLNDSDGLLGDIRMPVAADPWA